MLPSTISSELSLQSDHYPQHARREPESQFSLVLFLGSAICIHRTRRKQPLAYPSQALGCTLSLIPRLAFKCRPPLVNADTSGRESVGYFTAMVHSGLITLFAFLWLQQVNGDAVQELQERGRPQVDAMIAKSKVCTKEKLQIRKEWYVSGIPA